MYTHVDTAQNPIHLADHHAQHRMTYAMDVGRKDIGSPSVEVDIKDPRTIPQQRRKTEEGQ